MTPDGSRIGVFDSGLGGLTVVRELLRQLPGESVHYFADTAHVPYGPRPDADIVRFAGEIARHLEQSGCKAVVAACNLSSAVAVDAVAREARVPVLGVIRPGVRAALEACRGESIGVLATEGTVRSGAYPREIARWSPGLRVYQVACPDFVPLVESGDTRGKAAAEAAWLYTAPLRQAGVRTVVLGCTHYPFLLEALREAMPRDTCFVDPAAAAAAEVARVLRDRGALAAGAGPAVPHRFEASAEAARLERGAREWLGLEVRAELSALWSPTEATEKRAAATY